MYLVSYTLIVVFVISNIFLAIYHNRRNLGFVFSVWRRFSFRMLVECFVVLTGVLTIVIALTHYLPFTSTGWLDFVVEGGGNIFIAPVAAGSKSSYLLVRLLVPVFFAVLMLALPFLAETEEQAFRRGHLLWRSIAEKSVVFGLVHMIVGVPLAAAIGLIGMGFFYAHVYRSAHMKTIRKAVAVSGWENADVDTMVNDADNEAVMVSTAYHTLCNTIIVALMLVIALLSI